MKVICGNDIIEISRVKDAIESIGEKFLNDIYTENEIKYCESKKTQKYQSYAARFAAKEAAFKALNTYMEIDNWRMFEVINDERGKPSLIVHKENDVIDSLDISISHCKDYAEVYVVGILK